MEMDDEMAKTIEVLTTKRNILIMCKSVFLEDEIVSIIQEEKKTVENQTSDLVSLKLGFVAKIEELLGCVNLYNNSIYDQIIEGLSSNIPHMKKPETDVLKKKFKKQVKEAYLEDLIEADPGDFESVILVGNDLLHYLQKCIPLNFRDIRNKADVWQLEYIPDDDDTSSHLNNMKNGSFIHYDIITVHLMFELLAENLSSRKDYRHLMNLKISDFCIDVINVISIGFVNELQVHIYNFTKTHYIGVTFSKLVLLNRDVIYPSLLNDIIEILTIFCGTIFNNDIGSIKKYATYMMTEIVKLTHKIITMYDPTSDVGTTISHLNVNLEEIILQMHHQVRENSKFLLTSDSSSSKRS